MDSKTKQLDEIYSMAREAGFADGVVDIVGLAGFVNFANLVAAHEEKECVEMCAVLRKMAIEEEREECAKLCDEAEIRFAGLWDRFEYPCDQGSAEASRQIAAAIRARGEK